MSASVEGRTYSTLKEIMEHIEELEIANEDFGPSDGRVTTLNDLNSRYTLIWSNGQTPEAVFDSSDEAEDWWNSQLWMPAELPTVCTVAHARAFTPLAASERYELYGEDSLSAEELDDLARIGSL